MSRTAPAYGGRTDLLRIGAGQFPKKGERPPRVSEEMALRKVWANLLAESVAVAAAAQQKDQKQTVVVSAAIVAAEEGSVAVAAQAGQKDQPDNGAASPVVLAASAVCCY